MEFALLKRIASQALDAEEWLAERNAKAEYDCSTEDNDDPVPSARSASAVGPESEADRASPYHGG